MFRKFFVLIAAGLTILLAPASAAILGTYDNSTQSEFFALVNTTATIDFDSVLSGPNNYQASTDSTGFTLGPADNLVNFVGFAKAASFSTTVAWYPANEKDWGTNAVLSSYSVTPNDPNRHIHITLTNGATAIALNLMTLSGYAPYTSGASYTITLSTGDVLSPISTAVWSSLNSTSPLLGNVTPTWFGLISDTPITTIDLQAPADTLIIDNFTFGTAAAASDTPEAATLILIGTGLAGLAALRRFRPNALA